VKTGHGLGTEDRIGSSYITCKICNREFPDRSELIEHLRTEHEILELASYTAATMASDQERDRMAADFRRRFDLLKKELAGQDLER
jgi:hypothetical protein